MTIQNYTFFSPTGTEFPVSANADAKLYMMLSGQNLKDYRRRDWAEPINTALNRQYTNTSLVVGGRYFELSNETVNLTASSDNYIHANIDLTNANDPVSLSVELSDNSNGIDINNDSGVLKKCIEIVKTDTMGVVSAQTPEEVSSVDKINLENGQAFGSKMNSGWLEEKLDDNYYRWTRVVPFKGPINNGYRGSFFISAGISIPALPSGAVASARSVAVANTSQTGTWVFPDGSNTYRFINTVSVASASVTAIITAYGTK